MSNSGSRSPFAPCKPEEFAGRFDERKTLLGIIAEARERGQVVLVTGARGSGKSSFLDWAKYEMQDKPDSLQVPAIKVAFLETPGMIFSAYKDLLSGIKEHKKFGWFSKTLENPGVQKSIGVVLGVLEKVSSLAGPAQVGVEAGVTALEKLMPGRTYDHSILLTDFLKILHNLSTELAKNDKSIVLLLDDAQWASGPDFHLLKDLIRNVPSGIILIVSFRLQAESMESYVALRQELDRYGHAAIRMGGMPSDDIKDFSIKRFGISVDDKTAEFLSININDPLGLVGCFDLLKKKSLEPSLLNFQEILPKAVDTAQCVYDGLDSEWQDRVNTLCILHPPISLSVIACMLEIEKEKIKRLQDDLEQSPAFVRIEKELYDFAHASLREYCRKELPESMRIGLHSKAARCLEALFKKVSELSAALSLAEHLFFGQMYEKANVLNLELGEKFYDLFDFNLALELTDRAIISAEKTENKDMLGGSLHQKGRILTSLFRFSEALDVYNLCLKIAQEIGSRIKEAATLHHIGIVYQETNQFEKALSHYNRSLEIAREMGDRAGEAVTLHQIGMVYDETDRFEKALESYNKSLELKREIGDRAKEASTLHQIGLGFQHINRFEDAMKYYNKSLEVKYEMGDRAGEAVTLHQIGRVYEETNRFEEALKNYNKSLVIEYEIGYHAMEVKTLHCIGSIYEKLEKFEQALESYKQSLKVSIKIGYKEGEEVNKYVIKSLEKKMGKT
jgi:tetratricopeptide (TPR) repeat protein